METPVLNRSQQKKALSANKRKKETVKNVLATPYTHYWPLLSKEDNAKVLDLLKQNLPKLQNQKPKVLWKEIKNVPKEERKEFRKKFLLEDPIPDTPLRKYMIFGINETTKCLERNEASVVLVANDINPQFIIKHVIDLSVLLSVPVLVVTNLRNTLKLTTGITGGCFCIKKCDHLNYNLSLLCDTFRTVYENYPVPKNHINYDRCEKIKAFFNKSCGSDTDGKSEKVVDENEEKEKGKRFFTLINKDESMEESDEESKVEFMKENRDEYQKESSCLETYQTGEDKNQVRVNVLFSNFKIPEEGFYVRRTNDKERAFEPELSDLSKRRKLLNLQTESKDFFAFSTSNENEFLSFGKVEVKEKPYKSLVVNRIRGDKDRGKRKIEMLKKQKEENKRYYD